jgi:Carboxypeptidase regulatory-like domain/TonB dependent receptor
MTVVRRFLLVCAILALPGIGYAQEAVLTGTVTDSTGAVLPGVTVTAVLEATGNIFEAVTDSRGTYTIPVRVGVYRIKAELQSFAPVTRIGVQLLVGQTIAINLQMVPGGVAETVTVSAEAPLINTTTSSLGGNVDPRQVAELPVAGRNFMALAMLAPGSKTLTENATSPDTDSGRTGDIRDFQLNLDGQQVTRYLGSGDQPKYSQDMVAEFQYIANRFDATQGRSSGLVVNIVTKSGTNQLSGLFRANYRSSRFNAEEPVLQKVLPIDNLQLSTAVGGPIVKDKLHFFGNFEYERQPTESVWNTRYPSFNITLDGISNQKKGGLRVDYQLSPHIRLMGKHSETTTFQPFGPGTADHPAGTNTNGDYNIEDYLRLTQVLGNKAVNEIEGGRAVYGFHQEAVVTWSNNWQAFNGVTNGGPRIRFQDFNITQNRNLPKHQDQWVWNIHDNFTYSYEAAGRHDLKVGAEFLSESQIQVNLRNATGEIDARGGPTPANIQQLFPVWNNVDTWNLAALSPITKTYTIGVGDFNVWVYSKNLGAWAQDDWQVSKRLTLNLGLRYDVAIDAFANLNFGPFEKPGNYNDWGGGFQPRVGFAYKLNDVTVLRGGVGLYIANPTAGDATQATGNTQIAIMQIKNNGRPDFAANPFNGQPLPTYAQAQQLFCANNNNAKGCVFQGADEVILDPKYERPAHNWQASIGIQRQIGETIGVEADYVYNKANHEKFVMDNINMTYNPATGANYPFTPTSTRAFPLWGYVTAGVHLGTSESQELRTSFTKRFGDHWQASGTYSLRYAWRAEPLPISGTQQVTFPVAPDLGGEWGPAAGEQRHRAVLSGIYQVGHGFQVSALQYIGAGIRLANNYGTDLRDIQGNGGTMRLRPDGTIVPLNSLIGPPQSRTDLRFQQKIPLGGRAKLDGIFEVFNLLNSPNWTIGVSENRSDYLQHLTGEYRTAQVGCRLTF